MALGGDMNDLKLHYILSAKDDKIFGNIDQANLGTWTNFQTTLGVTAKDLEASLQSHLKKYIDIVNADLKNGIKIPNIFGVSYKDANISY